MNEAAIYILINQEESFLGVGVNVCSNDIGGEIVLVYLGYGGRHKRVVCEAARRGRRVCWQIQSIKYRVENTEYKTE